MGEKYFLLNVVEKILLGLEKSRGEKTKERNKARDSHFLFPVFSLRRASQLWKRE